MTTTKQIKLPPMFFKVGDSDYLKETLKEGKIKFGTFEGYRKQEEKEFEQFKHAFLHNVTIDHQKTDFFRRDSYEGLERRYKGKLNVNIKNKIAILDEAHLNIFQNIYKNLYCLYSFWPTESFTLDIDPRMKNFGNYVLIIYRPEIFLRTLFAKLEKKYDVGYVEFHNLDKIQYTPFSKRMHFSYQNEFRVVTNLENGDTIKIGNLEDIATIIPFSELENKTCTLLNNELLVYGLR